MNRVQGVVFADGTDRTEAINAAAELYGVPARILVAGALMESGLGKHRERWGKWPDVSFGDWHQTVRYAPIGNGQETQENIGQVRHQLLHNWDLSLEIAAKQYAHYWGIHQDALETFSRYNGGPN